ncbi:Ig-like domain-containing protein [Nocardioides sp. SYSU DS0663]|uniref:Ig-like domain-containing protein n=1 Tax=Nocardioides sp. SYSU DS0663 TaxID=3416445 RepID=UPI003F4C4A6D
MLAVLVALVAAGLGVVVLPAAPVSAAVPACAAAGISVESLGGPNFYIDSANSNEFRSSYTGYRVTNSTGGAIKDMWVSLTGFTGGSLALASGQPSAQRLGSLTPGARQSLFWYLTAAGASTVPQQHTVTVFERNPALSNAVPLCTTTDGFDAVATTIAANANKVTGVTLSGGAPTLGSLFTVTVTGDTGTIGSGVAGDYQSFWMSPAVTESWPASSLKLVGTSLTIAPDDNLVATTFTDLLRLANLGSSNRPYTATYTFRAVGFTGTATTVKPVQEIASGTQVKHTGSYPASIPAIEPAVNTATLDLDGSVTRSGSEPATVSLTATLTGTAGATLDSFVLTPPAGATAAPGSVTWAGAPTDDAVPHGTDLVFPGPFTLPDGGAASLTFDVRVEGDPGGQAFSVLGTVGPSFIGSTTTPVDGTNPATYTVGVNNAPTATNPTVTATAGTARTIEVAALASDPDGDALTVVSASGAAHGTVTIDGGDVVYTADGQYAGADSFGYTVSDGRGATVSGTVSVSVESSARSAQSITFEKPADLVVDGTATLVASASSGLPVSFASSTPSACTVAGAVVTAAGAGECRITASQAGDATWAPAPEVTQAFEVAKKSQSVTFATPAGMVIEETVALAAEASSGLPVGFSSTTPTVCTVAAAVVSAIAAGQCTVEAAQPGDDSWAAATPVERSFTVARKAQSISFTPMANAVVEETRTAEVTASSGLPVSLRSTTTEVCTVDGEVVTAAATGLCTVEATQGGNPEWAPAPVVTRSFDVTAGLLPQTIDFVQPGETTVGRAFAAAVHSSSGLSVTVTTSDPAVCSVAVVDGDVVVTTVGAGTCVLTARQPGSAAFAPAEEVVRSVTVTKRTQELTFDPPATGEVGTTFTPVVTSTSGLPATVASSTPAVCTVEAGAVTLHGVGTCTLTGTQEGDATFAAAAPVTRSLSVTATPVTPPPPPLPPAEPQQQTIHVDVPEVLLSGAGPVAVRAGATSGLPVALEVVAGGCRLEGTNLVAPDDTRCSVRATQVGNADWSPAEAVTRSIDFVSPADDAVSMESPATGPASLSVSVLANDPAGLELESVDAPVHGTATLDGGAVVYTPAARFRGVDELAYVVGDPLGRTARARVQVVVANAAPGVTGARLSQLAGTTETATVGVSDPNGDEVTLSVESGPGVSASVDGRRVRITPDRSVSGWVTVAVTADDGSGGTATTSIRSLVSPPPLAGATRRLVDGGTEVRWPRARTRDARYLVLVGGRESCTTSRTSCRLDRVLGPDFEVRVQVLGRDRTVSTRTLAEPRGHRQVLLRTVYFASGVDVLRGRQQRKLASVARLVRRLGFHDAHVSGYTDSDGGAAYNLALSRRRTLMVTTYLRRAEGIRSEQAWFGYDDPAASNDSAAGKALNRRVEILVSY